MLSEFHLNFYKEQEREERNWRLSERRLFQGGWLERGRGSEQQLRKDVWSTRGFLKMEDRARARLQLERGDRRENCWQEGLNLVHRSQRCFILTRRGGRIQAGWSWQPWGLEEIEWGEGVKRLSQRVGAWSDRATGQHFWATWTAHLRLIGINWRM